MEQGSGHLCAAIGRVMGEVLVRAPLTAEENFFACGGDSLRAVEMLQRLALDESLDGRLGSPAVQALLLEEVFEDATPRALATAAFAHAA